MAMCGRQRIHHPLKRKTSECRIWEDQQLLRSGAARAFGLDHQIEAEEERSVTLVVNCNSKTKPSFLKEGFSTGKPHQKAILPLRDPTSDMAVTARKGSALVKEMLQRKSLSKSRDRFWELRGSKIGNVIGVPDKKSEQRVSELHNAEKEAEFSAQTVEEHAGFNATGERRYSLPISTKRDELLQVIKENQVVVVIGETGSGKTTQLTQYLHEEGYTRSAMVGCTQPRRVAAVSVARRVSQEMGAPLGDKVGYAIRFEDVTGPNTAIKYITDGVLLREALSDPDLDRYSVIVLDEAHERSLSTDALFGVLKTVVQRRRDFKLIVTSATLDAQKFSNFFGGAPIFEIPGRPYKVDILYEKSHIEDYVAAAVNKALAIHLRYPPPGDILVFMTGQEEIEAAGYALAERMEQIMHSSTKTQKAIPNLLILPIYSQLPADLQAKIFQAAEDGTRKCIIATNIAETSLTLDGVSHVIDTGYGKMKVYNHQMGMDALQVFPISRAAADQRAGRAGRTGPGVCHRLYPESAFWNEMLASPVPEIQRTNLCNVILLLKSLEIDMDDFEFMDPPPQDNVINSMHLLWILGALDDEGSLTELGRKMVKFPLDPTLAKMVLMGEQLGCMDEVLTIVSMLSVPSVFFRPKERAEESDAAREKFFVPESDHLTLLNVYNQWQRHQHQSEWCNRHFLHLKELRKAREVRSQLLEIVHRLNIPLTSCGHVWDKLRKALCAVYCQNAAKLKGIREYVNCREGTPSHLHPSSAIYGSGFAPDYVVYHELLLTTTAYMQCVTAVEPHWLAELAPNLFSIKENDTSVSSDNEMKILKNVHAVAKKRRKEIKLPEQKQVVCMPGSKRCFSAQLRPKKLGL